MHAYHRRSTDQEDGTANSPSLDTRLIWAGFFFSLAIFAKVPGLDLMVSAHYFNEQNGFFLRDSPHIRALYVWTPRLGEGLLVLMLIYALIAPRVSRWFAARGKTELARRSAGLWRRAAVLFLWCALLGPGLVIEVVLKNTVGRPRPVQVEQFGGQQAYVGPFVLGEDPKHHRGFASGHASTGFALIALGLTCGPVWRRRWLLIGVVTGGIIGLGRIMQGAHFLSDIIFAFYAVWLSCELIAWFDRRQQRRRQRIT